MIARIRTIFRRLSTRFPDTLNTALGFAIVLALLWWLVAFWLRHIDVAPVWYDQAVDFTQVGLHLADPYTVQNFVNPPWTAVLLAPFAWLSLPLAALIQACLYFALLTAVIFKFGGRTSTVLIALVSFIALDAVIELNVDWVICLALVVPAAWSGPLLLVKPQDALGYWLSFKRRDLARAVLVTLVVLVVSLFLWWGWPLQIVQAIRNNTLGHFYNLAPMALAPWWLSAPVGLYLSWRAFIRRDPVLAILAWLFFVPYLTYYALLLPFALIAIRRPRLALLISIVMWLVFGGVVALGLLRRAGLF